MSLVSKQQTLGRKEWNGRMRRKLLWFWDVPHRALQWDPADSVFKCLEMRISPLGHFAILVPDKQTAVDFNWKERHIIVCNNFILFISLKVGSASEASDLPSSIAQIAGERLPLQSQASVTGVSCPSLWAPLPALGSSSHKGPQWWG